MSDRSRHFGIETRPPPKRICIWGTSLRKVGDEAQILAAIQIVREVRPNSRISIFARGGKVVSQSHSDVFTTPTANLPRVAWELARCDLFVMIGGCFMESKKQALVCGGLLLLAKSMGKPVIGYAVTVLPYRTRWGRTVYRWIFNRLTAISARERTADEILGGLGIGTEITHYPDPRMVLEPASRGDIEILFDEMGIDPSRPIVGVTTRYLHSAMPEWVKQSQGYSDEKVHSANLALGRALDALSHHAQIVLIPMHPSLSEDRATWEAIRGLMERPDRFEILDRSVGSKELLGLIRACDLLIAGRLASGMMAFAMGTPVLGIAYEKRLIDMMTSAGEEKYVRPWTSLGKDDLSRIAMEIWTDRTNASERYTARAIELIDKARANTTIFERLVTD